MILAVTASAKRVARPESSKSVGDKTSNSDHEKKQRTENDHAPRESSGCATHEHFVWVWTLKGLFRIARSDWSVAHQWMHEWMLPKDRDNPSGESEKFPYSYLDNRVNTLTVDGDELWI